MPWPAVGPMLEEKKEAAMPHWMHFVDWIWMSAIVIFWILLIALIGYAAVLVSWRHTNSPGRHGPKSA